MNNNFSNIYFDDLKNDFIEFLKSQDEFKSYNFEGTNFSILLDVLSYNTYYNLLYLNMVQNESYLDTATLRKNIILKAKSLGYIPKSKSASTAIIKVSANLPEKTYDDITLPKYYEYVSRIDNKVLSFFTLQSYKLVFCEVCSDGTYLYETKEDVRIYEGMLNKETFTNNIMDKEQKFILKNPNVDTDTIEVKIYPYKNSTNFKLYYKFDSLLNLNELSRIYFVQEIENGQYEIQFGDGILGAKLEDGNFIEVSYLYCSSNNISNLKNFNQTDGLGVEKKIKQSIEVLSTSTKQIDKESTQSIKMFAPLNYETQNRLVTISDYETIIKKEYPSIETISVWGGENNDPPEYGKVFISIKPQGSFYISESLKNEILRNIIKPRSILTVKTEFVDPNFIYIDVLSEVYYQNKMTNLVQADIITLVKDYILSYSLEELNEFHSNFKYSKLVKGIDLAGDVIDHNLTNITLNKRFEVTEEDLLKILYGHNINYTLKFSNPLNVTKQIISNTFTYNNIKNCFFANEIGDTYLNIYTTNIVTSDIVIVEERIGVINFKIGLVNINNFRPVQFEYGSLAENYIRLTVTPINFDIFVSQNQILSILPNDININVIESNGQ